MFAEVGGTVGGVPQHGRVVAQRAQTSASAPNSSQHLCQCPVSSRPSQVTSTQLQSP